MPWPAVDSNWGVSSESPSLPLVVHFPEQGGIALACGVGSHLRSTERAGTLLYVVGYVPGADREQLD